MKTLVVGASENPERYSNKAIHRLLNYGHEVVAFSNKKGKVENVNFQTDFELFKEIDTVTMYVNPARQTDLIESIINLNPRRIIFNPGAENKNFEKLASQKNIIVEQACTLVMLGTGQY